MTSDFKKIIIVVAVIFVIALFFWMGVVFFTKDNSITKTTDNQQEKEQMNDYDKKPEITEEEKIKTFAENFVEIYNTYMINDFSNMESLKDSMTQELWDEKLQWIEMEKEKIKDKPKQYIIFNTQASKSNIVSFDNGEAVVEIECEQFEIRGASIYIGDVLTNVDEFGEITLIRIPRKSETKKVALKLIKKNNEWKVDNIEIIKNQNQD